MQHPWLKALDTVGHATWNVGCHPCTLGLNQWYAFIVVPLTPTHLGKESIKSVQPASMPVDEV